jgi:hypothetical protein
MDTVLYAPEGYWKLSGEDKKLICNGCGPQGHLDFIPDSIYFLNISEACNIHDYCYEISRSNIKDKEWSDRIFLNNLLRLIEVKTKWRWLKWLRRKRAYNYYLAVKHFGSVAFWVDKNESKELGRVIT